jgi:hypothetical protein
LRRGPLAQGQLFIGCRIRRAKLSSNDDALAGRAAAQP